MSAIEPIQRDWSAHPAVYSPHYKSSIERSPRSSFLSLDTTLTETTSPSFHRSELGELDHDLIRNYIQTGEPIGERVIIHGTVRDQRGEPVPNALVEIWQANAGGRYRHVNDRYLAPIDPNFGGCGRTVSDAQGRYFFRTIRPGAYPFRNQVNDWRPAHIHFSVIGSHWAQRMITQMYFEGDPMIAGCPIIGSMQGAKRDSAVRTMIALLDRSNFVALDSRAYQFDIVLRGSRQTFFENLVQSGAK